MTFNEATDTCNWTSTSQINVLMQFIENQEAAERLEDWLDWFVKAELDQSDEWENLMG